jgi:acyl carrier protein
MSSQADIRTFVVENFLFGEGDALKDDTSFLKEGILDSTGILQLVSFIEQRYEIAVGDEELIPENLDSIDRVSLFVDKKKGLLSAPA